ncbi:hypothetical protein HN807_00450 [Candidatus Bathyarchaeota archaeon]|nr:hypothetical protein [Candidatus Bathyarchaeota archaeon]MBT3284626.1 hypothetical protein [Candidatus Bathyarchaeota archaeon]MBT4321038.1 hypothetical protein [Candidatus Bathyarchaeota archaeon]MBT4425082.1 hypothetical protein [Candidatus Bathyarchaeota archaeon]MBT6605859.1 hypothetical protein [Candidatus Bathyarchaeota archaeon]
MDFRHFSFGLIILLILGISLGVRIEPNFDSNYRDLVKTNSNLEALTKTQNDNIKQLKEEIQILEEAGEGQRQTIKRLGDQIVESALLAGSSYLDWTIQPNKTEPFQETENLSNEQYTVGDDLKYSHRSIQNSTSNNKTNVILISIDGFSRQRFNQYKEELTTINGLLNQGWLQYNITNYAYYTQTKNGHATMLSGYLGTETGIYGNGFVYNQLPTGYSILEKAEKKYGSNEIATGFISGKYKNIYPVFNQTALEELDYVNIQEQTSEETGDLCLSFLEEYGETHFSAFFHFRDPDKSGHRAGEGSVEWKNNLTLVDEQINRIIVKLNETGVLDRTKIYLTTDHGFLKKEKTHKHEPLIWLLTNDMSTSINRNSTILGLQDIAPTICVAMDLPYNYTSVQSGQPLQHIFSREKYAFRLEYLVDDSPPLVDILRTEESESGLRIWVQVSGDVNQLYLVSDFNDYDGSVLDEMKIPLGTSIVTLEIKQSLFDQYGELYLVVYDFAENSSLSRIRLD